MGQKCPYFFMLFHYSQPIAGKEIMEDLILFFAVLFFGSIISGILFLALSQLCARFFPHFFKFFGGFNVFFLVARNAPEMTR